MAKEVKGFAFLVEPDYVFFSVRVQKLSLKSRGVLFSLLGHQLQCNNREMESVVVPNRNEFSRQLNISNFQMEDFLAECRETGACTYVADTNAYFFSNF